MTEEQAHDIIRQLTSAQDKKELQKLIGQYVSACDDVFFSVLSETVERMRALGDEANAHKLKEMGDMLARLRFLI